MSALTFLDYSHLEATGKNIEAKLEQKEKEIAYLRMREVSTSDEIALMRLQHEKEMKEFRQQMD